MRSTIAALSIFCVAYTAPAQQSHAVVALDELQVTAGRLEGDWGWSWDLRLGALLPQVRIDGDGGAWFAFEGTGWGAWRFGPALRDARIAVEVPAPRDVTGTLYLPADDWQSLRPVRFTIPAARFGADRRNEFLQAQRAAYLQMLQRELPGGAWFRHRVLAIDRELGVERPLVEGSWTRRRGGDDLAETLELFGGGRAIAENLQLDRALPAAGGEGADVDVATIEGITMRAIDWTPHLAEQAPEPDPLAPMIPHDQHAVFLPDLAAAVRVVEELDRRGTPLGFLLGTPRAEEHALLARYERQLAIDLRALARELPPDLVGSVALTGSDLELRMGTDVALLFDTAQPQELARQLLARIDAAGAGAPPSGGPLPGAAWRGRVSPDRAISAHLMQLDRAVVLTNSPAQLQRLLEVRDQRLPALAAEPEYRFFRQRYPRVAGQEAAFAVLSDATIRRWCGPQWRIASARRVRAAGFLAELTARHAQLLGRAEVMARDLAAEAEFRGLGKLRLEADGVRSSAYGSLAFMTPIAELDTRRAGSDEAEAYGRWRRGYERNWSGVFDPIAWQFQLEPDRIASDVTVMPLILGSEYNWLRQLTLGAKLSARPLELAEPLAHLAIALEPKSNPMRMVLGFAGGLGRELGADPFGWMGQTVAIYADQDPFWAELAAAGDRDEFFEQNWHRLPIGLVAEVGSALKATAFLAGLRAYVQDTAPGMTQWQSIEHAGGTYVRVSPSPQAAAELSEFERRATFSYIVSGRRILVALNENLIRQALERGGNGPEPPAVLPGEHAWLRIGADAFAAVEALAGAEIGGGMQVLSWRNLPILEEWAREFPGQDPVTVHERLFGVRLICPGGGQYLRDPQHGLLGSSVYGHPAAPRRGPRWPPGWRGIGGADFGITFEADGLRARVEVRHK